MNPVFYDRISTAVGPVLIAVRDRKVVAVQIGGSASDFRYQLLGKGAGAPLKNATTVRNAARQIREYLAGKRQTFRLNLDWSGIPPFRARVLRAALRIPYGKTRTYGEIARLIGKPHAARAVGQALGANPFAPVVPCHRVLAINGGLGGYSAAGGVAMKRRLLRMESSL